MGQWLGKSAQERIDLEIRNALLSAKTYSGADRYRDHVPMAARF